MFSWKFPYPSQRMPVLAKNVIATSQPLAAQAGLAMLARGGNAVDAGLAAAGRSPAGWTPERFAGRKEMPKFGWDSVTVPGAVSSWIALSKRYGKLPFET